LVWRRFVAAQSPEQPEETRIAVSKIFLKTWQAPEIQGKLYSCELRLSSEARGNSEQISAAMIRTPAAGLLLRLTSSSSSVIGPR
jgi:hypothetical protein